ncbi:SDR family oxidoreductase [Sulfurimonas sp.]|uniref:SDR family NAD(P)-dependent oxidoreductase n=1 Tax=Sulfurimonas sp. TaxID=2022749 RepID=UPI0025F45D3D|nr:SDR family oxidoreductase [Sulfurimonas sp.]
MNKKVALVTGSSKGIGKGIAKILVENDYIVYINGRDSKDLENSAKELENKVKTIKADLSDDKNIQEAIKNIIKTEKRLDLVVSNIGSGKSIMGWDVSIEEHKRVFDVNFFSAVSLANHSIKAMKNSRGHIIFIASIAGCESIGAPIAYSSAKTALYSFAKALSKNIAKLNIRVNTISPGNVMFEGSTWDDKIKNDKISVETYIQNNVPLNTFATPSDIAKTVMFLEESDFITGSNIVVDGGQLNKII